MTAWLTSLSIGRKSTLLLITLAFQVCIPLFGVNELSKATLFTFLEREHIVLTNQVKDMLYDFRFEEDVASQRELMFAKGNNREKMGIESLVKEIKRQPERCLETVNLMEVILFRMVGFGEAIDLCHKDIKDNERALAVIEKYKSGKTSDRLLFVEQLEPIMEEISVTSERFALLIPKVVSFVQWLITICVILFSIINAFFVIVIMQDLRKRITYVSDGISDICETNRLNDRLEHNNVAEDEIDQACISFNSLLDKFGGVVNKLIDNSQNLSTATTTLYQRSETAKTQLNNQHMETDLVATAVTEMASAVEEISSNTNRAAEAAQQGLEYSTKGKESVNKAISSVDRLANELAKMAEVVTQLDTDTTAIGGILDVIRGVAEQTNLLALNAAIEAARAGEQGRGFAVVADEVRSLASRTQESTEEIHQMIEQLQTGAKQAVTAMESNKDAANETISEINIAGETLSSIANATEMIRDMGIQIATATEEQTGVVSEIQKNLINIQAASEDTSSAASDIHDASEQVSHVTASMNDTVGQFKINE